MQDSLDFILLFWLPAVANFLRLQLLCEFFVTSVWWAVIKFTGQGCALESWLYTSIFLSIPLKSPLQKLKIKFILLEFSQQTLVRNVVASDLLRGLFFFWKRCDGEFWAWWLCENDDFSVTVDWKKKSKIIPLQTSTNGQLSKMAIFFLWTVHTFTLVSTCPLYNGHFLLFPRWLLGRVSTVLTPNRGQTYDLLVYCY